jgi:hypothetical protein
MLPDFWRQVHEIDWSRKESLLSVVPELEQIIQYRPVNERPAR